MTVSTGIASRWKSWIPALSAALDLGDETALSALRDSRLDPGSQAWCPSELTGATACGAGQVLWNAGGVTAPVA